MADLVKQIHAENRKKEAREQWVAMLPLMAAKILKYTSWSEYYDQTSGQNIDLRPEAEILAEVEEIRKYV